MTCADKYIKERFIRDKGDDDVEENFTDDEESDDEGNGAGECYS